MPERRNDPEQGFSRLAGGLFAAFSLPTVAQLATQHDIMAVPLVLLLAATGLLLAGFQLSIGELADYPGEIRAVLSYTGLALAAAALATMVITPLGPTPAVIAATAALALGVGVPIGLRINKWTRRHRSSTGNTSRGPRRSR